MLASKCGLRARVLALLIVVAGPARAAEAATHAELSALLESGNVLGSVPAEPPFWEGLGSLRSGRESRGRLGASLVEPGLVRDVETSARLRLDLALTGLGEGTAPRLSDASSWVQLAWQPAIGLRLSLRGYPFDTDYVRVGYLHSLDWGGTQVAARESVFLARKSGAPGFLVRLDSARLRLFAGVKWARTGDGIDSSRRSWGALAGGSAALAAFLRLELGAGFFERDSGFVEGASMRWVWHRGPSEPDVAAEPFRAPLLRDDPERLDAEEKTGAALALEGALLVLRTPSQQRLITAPAAALYGSVREGPLAAHFALTWRSLAFVLRNDARYVSESGPARAELAAWLGGSFTLRSLALIPSFELGGRLPAAIFALSSAPGIAQVWVASGAAGLAPLPLGSSPLPVLAARVALRWQASSSVGFVVASDYQREPHRTRLVASGTGLVRSFDTPDSLAVLGGLRARW